MADTDQKMEDKARDEIFAEFLETNADTDASAHDSIKKAISLALQISGRNFQMVMQATTTLSLRLPPDVDYEKGSYTSFMYTVADSPMHGRVVLTGGRHGLAVTTELFQQHYDTMKHVINNNAPEPITKH